MNKLSDVSLGIVRGGINVLFGAAFVAVAVPLGLAYVAASSVLPSEPYTGEDTYGFKDGDFVRMHKEGR